MLVTRNPSKQKVIITGSEGRIGKIICKTLSDDYEVFKLDIDEGAGDHYFKTDVSDLEMLKTVFEKTGPVFAVIHLAAASLPKSSWEEVYKHNILGTRNLFECARAFDVQKTIITSSIHVSWQLIQQKIQSRNLWRGKPINTKTAPAPVSDYGMSKAAGEILAKTYHAAHGLNVICLRIGFFKDYHLAKQLNHKLIRSTWLSPDDMNQLISKALTSKVTFGLYWGVSKNKHNIFDMKNSRKEIGYFPVDDHSKLH